LIIASEVVIYGCLGFRFTQGDKVHVRLSLFDVSLERMKLQSPYLQSNKELNILAMKKLLLMISAVLAQPAAKIV